MTRRRRVREGKRANRERRALPPVRVRALVKEINKICEPLYEQTGVNVNVYANYGALLLRPLPIVYTKDWF